MTCKALNREGKPCAIATKNEYCHIHKHKIKIKEQQSNLGGLNKRIETYRNTIAELINEKADICYRFDDLKRLMESEKRHYEKQIEDLHRELSEYREIKKFNKLYERVRSIIKTDDKKIFDEHLKLIHPSTSKKLLEVFEGRNPYSYFYLYKRNRNMLAHCCLEDDHT
jgi:predicted RNase H-like nuclease (RuvC/YqgF family)